MEKLIFFALFMTVSAVYNWYIKKKGQSEGEGQNGDGAGRPTAPPAGQPAPRPVKATSWEEELRKLLEGETTVTPAPRPRPSPPPVVIAPTDKSNLPPPIRTAAPRAPRPVVPPPVRVVRPTQSGRVAAVRPPARPAVVRASSPRPVPLAVPAVTSLSTCDLAPMAQSKQAYAKAGQLDKVVAAHISKVPAEHVKPTYVLRAEVMPDVVQVAGLFKNSRGARQAMIASLILGPPRALEDAAWLQ